LNHIRTIPFGEELIAHVFWHYYWAPYCQYKISFFEWAQSHLFVESSVKSCLITF
jgi:hypothetical protein